MKTQIIHGIKTGPSVPIDNGARGGNTAAYIKKHFPNVKTVSDAMEPVRIDVSLKDKQGATPHSHTNCAFARAAKRCLKTDGAYIGIDISYVVFGTHAIRFRTPATVAREIPSFDRHEDFASGIYRLSAMPPSRRIGRPRGGKTNLKSSKKAVRKGALIPMHNGTARIRSEEELMAA